MNRNCHGEYYQNIGYYRCLYDGDVMPMPELLTDCPNCDRAISAKVFTDAKIRHKEIKITEIVTDSEGYGGMIDKEERIIAEKK
jgi:hypothetical protein